MPFKDYYIGPTGSNSNNGQSYANRVQTWPKMNQLIASENPPGINDTVRIFVDAFDFSSNGAFGYFGNFTNNNVAANATISVQCANGILITAYDPTANWHFSDIRTLTNTADFTDLGGGIWRTSTTFVTAGLSNKAVRVWRCATSLTDKRLAVLDPDNELFEAASYATLGDNESHAWTQVDSGNTWGTSDTTPTSFAAMRTLYLYSPKGNPATVWGGIAVLTQEGFHNFMRIQGLDNWTLDDSIKCLGGGQYAFRLNGGSNWRFEPQILATSPYRPAVAVNEGPLNTTAELQNCTLAPRIDALIKDRPFYPFESGHHNGGFNDLVQFGTNACVRNIRFAAKSTSGLQSHIRGANHSAIARGVGGSGYIHGLTIEPEFLFDGSGQQYSRAFAFNGTGTSLTGLDIGGRVYNMRAPDQIHGSGFVRNYKSFNRLPMIPAARNAANNSGLVTSYTSRFGGQTRNYGNALADGKWWDAQCLAIYNSGANVRFGHLSVVDCEFDAPMGPAVAVTTDATPAASQSVTVANCLFRRGSSPGEVGVAVQIDTRNSCANAVRLINNTEIGGMQNATFNGADRVKVSVDGLVCAVNTGWKSYATDAEYRAALSAQIS